jgi:hypothetical protein
MISTDQQKSDFFADFREKFEWELAHSSHCHSLIITSEHFHSSLKDDEELQNLKDFLERYFTEIQVVCYFREQADMVRSLYSTALKGDATFSFEALLNRASPENYYFNPYAIAEKWSSVFSRENCEFRIYNPDEFLERDIRKDFMQAIGFSPDFSRIDFEVMEINKSISALEAPVYRGVNKNLPYWSEAIEIRKLNRAIKSKIRTVDSLKVGKIYSDRQKKISDDFSEVNERFVSEFLNHQSHFPEPNLQNTSRSFSQEEVSRILEATCDVLLEEISKLAMENTQLKAGRDNPPVERYKETRLYDILDYRVHKWLSETPLVSSKIRKRFRGPAERRWRKLGSEPQRMDGGSPRDGG